jgi:opacity protein-like surface antigen
LRDAAKAYIISETSRTAEQMKKIAHLISIAGFILLCLLNHSVAAEDLKTPGIKLRVAAEQANIREKPDITSSILQQLPEGAILEAERKEGAWYAVLVEKDEEGPVVGYVHESLVVVVEEAPAGPPQIEPPKDREAAQEQPAKKPAEETSPRYNPPPVQPVSTRTVKEEQPAVTFWFGGRYASVGDLNEGAEGLARYYEAHLGTAGEGDAKALHLSYLFGVEARLPLAFGFHFSLAAEYGSGESTSSIVYDDGTQELRLVTKPRVRAIPISLSLVYYPSPSLYFKAGLEYTFARCGYSYRLSEIEPGSRAESWQEWTGEANSSRFGYLAGLGYDWDLSSALSLSTELLYRHIRLDDFGGEDVYKESSSYESVEKGKLYYFRVDSGAAEVVPLVFVREKRPSEAGVMDARKAELSLSGFSLKLGIKIRF